MSRVKGLFDPQKGHVDNSHLKGTKPGAEESKTIVPIREDVGWDLYLLVMREAIPEGKVGGLVDRSDETNGLQGLLAAFGKCNQNGRHNRQNVQYLTEENRTHTFQLSSRIFSLIIASFMTRDLL